MVNETNACAKCARCGRRLTNPKSAVRGMGRWCAKKAAQVVTFTTPFDELAASAPVEVLPAVAPSVVPLVALNERRQSSRFPGLSYEVQTTARGHYIEFRNGLARDGYELIAGKVSLVWQSDKGVMPSQVSDYCKQFAIQLAGHLAQPASQAV